MALVETFFGSFAHHCSGHGYREDSIFSFFFFFPPLHGKIGIAMSLEHIMTVYVCGNDFPKAFRTLI